MRNRSRTIESLRRLAERPGTPHEGETARMLLAKLGAIDWTPLAVRAIDVPVWDAHFLLLLVLPQRCGNHLQAAAENGARKLVDANQVR